VDVGADAILARLGPLEPKVLFFHPVQREGGSVRELGAKIATVREGLPSLVASVSLGDEEDDDRAAPGDAARFATLLATEPGRRLDELPRFPWNHPMFIAFSSGTTGRPKCLVHGAGGTLLEQHKEHRLHADLGRSDKLYFHTTPGWMMWNWLVSALASGTEIVLYEGAVTHPRPDALWDLVARERVTVFGTSPAFLQYSRDAGMVPSEQHDFSSLRALQSTGSVLKDALFHWVVDAVKRVPVQSISGGTDIMGCFLLGHPWLPVYPGELQSKSLGLDVSALGGGTTGELVCRNAFPSRPTGLYDDPSGERLHDAYFAQNPGVWTHGDLVEWTSHRMARIHGRTDGVLKVRGVRIGPAEIYAALEPIDAIADAMALEQRAPDEPGGSRLVLAVVLRAGVSLDKDLRGRIRRTLSERGSPAHVPEVILDVPELVRTHNGKKAERAARDALNGDPIANLDALANPEALDALRLHPALARNRSGLMSEPPAAPGPRSREDTERRVLRIWQQVLGAESVAPDDDFHELGGHSLVAITILLKVRTELGAQLPMGVFLGPGATPAGMAALLMDASAGPSGEGCLVAIHPAGTRRPVVWLPGGGGLSTMAFREVSLLLGEDRPVYGFEAPMPRAGEDEPFPEVEATAARYVRELRAAFPGPYAIFGFSYGCFMAFEVACQLEEAGEVVSPFVIFDAEAPGSSTSASLVTRRLMHRIGYHAARLRKAPGTHATFLAEQLRARVLARLPARREPAPRGQELFDTLNQRNLEAVERYRKRPLRLFPRRITLVLATDSWQSALPPELDPRLGWRFHAQGGVDIHRVRGSHLSMLRRPEAQDLAAMLRGCLDAADDPESAEAPPVAYARPPALNLPDHFHYTLRLDRFRKENTQLGPTRGERVILFGDSHFERFDHAWFAGRDVVNRGVIADHLHAHGPTGLLHRWHRSLLGPDPSHIFVMVGVNDLASGATVAECVARYEKLIACLEREYPAAVVVCHTVPPTRGRYDYLNGAILHFNDAISSRLGAHVLDVHSRLTEGPRIARRYTSDGLHLARPGYAVWSDQIHAFMEWKRPAPWLSLPWLATGGSARGRQEVAALRTHAPSTSVTLPSTVRSANRR
jgi:acetoacetyl-CoA synthetase